jgi:hypothetical protein
MAAPSGHVPIEGLVDSITIALAFVIVVGKLLTRWKLDKRPFATVGMCTVDLLNGAVVLPFMLMVGAVFSSVIYDYLKSASAGTTALAGGIGLFFVLGELSKLD